MKHTVLRHFFLVAIFFANSAVFSAPQNVVVVATVLGPGVDFTNPVTALNSIVDSSASNPYLISIAPGRYTISSPMVMQPFVTVRGSGVSATIIRGNGATNQIVTMVGNAELSRLTVLNNTPTVPVTGIGCANQSGLIDIRNVNVSVSNGAAFSSTGMRNNNCNRVSMKDMNIRAGAGDVGTVGVHNFGGSVVDMKNIRVVSDFAFQSVVAIINSGATITMSHVEALALNGSTSTVGIQNVNASVTGSDIIATSNTTSQPTQNVALFNDNSSVVMNDITATAIRSGTSFNTVSMHNRGLAPRITNARIVATGGAESRGIYNENASPTVENTLISAYGSTINYGVFNESISNPIFRNVNVQAVTGTAYSVSSNASSPRFESAELNGGIQGVPGTVNTFINSRISGNVSGGGTFQCLASYNASLAPISASCL